MYAARVDHVEKLIRPALERGVWVISDRFSDSTMAYQGYARGLGPDRVKSVHKAIMDDFEPDLTILIDMDPDTGLTRALSRQGTEERFEDFGPDLQRKMRAGFLALADEFSDRFRVIDGARDIDSIAADVHSTALKALG